MLESNYKFFAIEITIIIISLLIIIFNTILTSFIESSEIVYFKDISNNWGKGPITEIISSSTGSCPDGYNYLIEDKWPGLIESCICNDFQWNNYIFGKVRKGRCATGKNERDSFFFCRGKTLCSKRLNKDYMHLFISSKSSFCQLNTRSCGKADSLGNYLCVPSNVNCPINTLQIVGKNEVPSQAKFNYTRVNLNDKDLVYTNQNIEGSIVIEFKLSDNQPCSNPSYVNTNLTSYKLDPYYGRDKCENGLGNDNTDKRYIQIDEYNYFEIVNQNNITKILYLYPEYPILTLSHLTKLYYRPFIGIKDECFKYFNAKESLNSGFTLGVLNDIQQISLKTENSSSLSKGLTIYIWIANIIMIIIGFFFIYYLTIDTDPNNTSISSTAQFIIKALKFLLSIIMFILTCTLHTSIHKIPDLYRDLLIDGFTECNDAYTNDLFHKFTTILGKVKHLSIANIFFSILLFLILSIFFAIFYFTKPTQQNQSQELQFGEDEDSQILGPE